MCDSNPHMIGFYKAIKLGEITPNAVRFYLEKEGRALLEKGGDHYYYIRDRFNEKHDPLDFLFLNRSGFNGMIRFNRKGGLNIPFCKKPERFSKSYVTKIVNQVSNIGSIIKAKDISFKCQGFEETISEVKEGDIIYCDPPYIDRSVDYYNSWDESNEVSLFRLLSNAKCDFILSTWHHNKYRKNNYIDSHWGIFNVLTREHFYHVGGSEKNRSSMVEAIVTSLETKDHVFNGNDTKSQLGLLDTVG